MTLESSGLTKDAGLDPEDCWTSQGKCNWQLANPSSWSSCRTGQVTFCFMVASLSLSLFPPFLLSVSVSLSLFVCLSVCRSFGLSVSVSVSVSLCLSLSVSLSLSVCLSVCLSLSLSLSLCCFNAADWFRFIAQTLIGTDPLSQLSPLRIVNITKNFLCDWLLKCQSANENICCLHCYKLYQLLSGALAAGSCMHWVFCCCCLYALGGFCLYLHSRRGSTFQIFQSELPVPVRPSRNETAAQVNCTDIHQMEVLHL